MKFINKMMLIGSLVSTAPAAAVNYGQTEFYDLNRSFYCTARVDVTGNRGSYVGAPGCASGRFSRVQNISLAQLQNPSNGNADLYDKITIQLESAIGNLNQCQSIMFGNWTVGGNEVGNFAWCMTGGRSFQGIYWLADAQAFNEYDGRWNSR